MIKDIIERHAEKGRVDVVPLSDDNRFWSLAKALTKLSVFELQQKLSHPIIALDPGETTGFAYWDPRAKAIYMAQIITKDIPEGFDALNDIINRDMVNLSHVRFEDYRVYGHMTEQHAFSHLHTARMIGAIEVICHLAQVPSSCCLAMHAKTFWTDDKLKMCELYNPGMKHARDAQRHLLRYMTEL